MIIGAAEFLEVLLLMRMAWLRGFVGSGKTMLAVLLADLLLREGAVDGVIANFPTILPPMLGRDDGTLFGRCVIFDEAWTLLDSRSSLVNPTEYGAYARKLRSYWLFPSVIQIDKRMRAVTVWRDFRVRIPFFGGVWIYKWQLDVDYAQQEGRFAVVRPEKRYGIFDTDHIPVDDGGIYERWSNSVIVATQGMGVIEGDKLSQYLEGLALLANMGIGVGDAA